MAGTYDIDGKVAIVTGGTRGIGLAIARDLAKRGAMLVVAGVRPAGAEAVARLNEDAGRAAAVFRQCDVASPDELYALIDFAVEHYGRLDILVNNAGILDVPYQDDPTGSHNRKVLDVGARAMIDGTTHALRIWDRDPDARGVVVNVASVAAYMPVPYLPIYAASKAATVGFTKAMAGLAPKVRINAIAPAWVDTDMADTPHITRDHFSIQQLGLLTVEETAAQAIRAIEDESLAGDVIIVLRGEEPRICRSPKGTSSLEEIAEKNLSPPQAA
ncbi:hypothetical protein H4R18_004351 [Coemansia javaensis]|uniref:Ketoreductase domain-containing protein n=1 Tax=Coemansia javaensis TaxID=2761396 RepID=A0A9W8H4I0_9FUNG|nr:hypothetical protein H4R18_004351 [Coemansia javaensis]